MSIKSFVMVGAIAALAQASPLSVRTKLYTGPSTQVAAPAPSTTTLRYHAPAAEPSTTTLRYHAPAPTPSTVTLTYHEPAESTSSSIHTTAREHQQQEADYTFRPVRRPTATSIAGLDRRPASAPVATKAHHEKSKAQEQEAWHTYTMYPVRPSTTVEQEAWHTYTMYPVQPSTTTEQEAWHTYTMYPVQKVEQDTERSYTLQTAQPSKTAN